MARRKSVHLTDGELRLMRVLWRLGRATVADVVRSLHERPRPAYNTVLTMLRILEQKGYVAHHKQARAFVYRPLVGKSEARRSAVRHLVSRLFDDSPGLLALNLLAEAKVDPREIERLERLLAEREEKDR